MDKIIKCITSDGAVLASVIDSTDIVYTAQKVHSLSPVATAALGRLLSVASMMGIALKNSESILNVRISGGGELGTVLAVADFDGNVKGYVGNPSCKTTYYENGKINVGKAVGKEGTLSVMKSFGSGDPYIGQVPIVSGEIAEDITSYFATSEQFPTVCALGVLVDKETGQSLLAGGLLLQLLPGAGEDTIEKIEKNLETLEPVTTMMAKGMSSLEICKTALKGFEVETLEEREVKYACSCNREKIKGIIQGMPKAEIETLPDEKGNIETNCTFCNKKYVFTKEDIEEILKNK